jgi:hypothetical protein
MDSQVRRTSGLWYAGLWLLLILKQSATGLQEEDSSANCPLYAMGDADKIAQHMLVPVPTGPVIISCQLRQTGRLLIYII